ncbi:MAG: hypothetical protein K6G11_09810 [Lachnospiraceae bacterium]|nr:hypothetical protein [Lachnospiraceae bacterium]
MRKNVRFVMAFVMETAIAITGIPGIGYEAGSEPGARRRRLILSST